MSSNDDDDAITPVGSRQPMDSSTTTDESGLRNRMGHSNLPSQPQSPDPVVRSSAAEGSGVDNSNTKIMVGLSAIAIILVCALFFWAAAGPNDGSSCHSLFANSLNHLSTKTPYIHHAADTLAESNSHCAPEQIWLMIRHGTRNPNKKVIQAMKQKLPAIRDEIVKHHHQQNPPTGELCEGELAQLINWEVPRGEGTESEESWDLVVEKEKHLTPQGVTELNGIGKRFKQKFPRLFGPAFSNSTYKFKYTKTQRAKESAIAFVTGIFGEDEAQNVWFPEALKVDPVLRFYKGCPKWIKNVDKNPDAYKEQKIFEESSIFRDMIARVSKRLGYGGESQLDSETIRLMYVMCGFESSWNGGQLSPWCIPFTEEDLKVLEYWEDIEYYWIDGYGHEITYKSACPAINDALAHFDRKSTLPKIQTPNVIAYFSHSGTLLKLISRFGLFNDSTPLLGTNYEFQRNRLWKTSQIDKFATNLGLVLYKCSGENSQEEYRVGAMFQEKRIPLDACNGAMDCPLSQFKEYMRKLVHDCDIETMCKL